MHRRHKGPPSLAVLRVAQLDAGRLDVELASMLQEQLRKAFAFFRPVRHGMPQPVCDGAAGRMFDRSAPVVCCWWHSRRGFLRLRRSSSARWSPS